MTSQISITSLKDKAVSALNAVPSQARSAVSTFSFHPFNSSSVKRGKDARVESASFIRDVYWRENKAHKFDLAKYNQYTDESNNPLKNPAICPEALV